ncbi:type II secretion system protein GspH [Ectothiorhodospira shaposhnikovii]|uniref:GspH/FimT family pseudopilin n=1 Tax=Ectothiorhodospira shaposhnikovii TaxID=1054 RepID=UPI001908F732|nr:GspH/FimT family pseudopilin [Ectothiorhodospira shaposhnikovii]MBK1672622.1 type II secretion system protein GspH [Ectothiorhodospira shaposhnikovii]
MARSIPRRQGGFTLMELLVVLIIAVGLLGLAGVRFAAGTPGAELRAAAREMTSGLRYVRAAALSSGQEQVLLVDVDNGRYWIAGREQQTRRVPERVDIHLVTSRDEVVSDRVAGLRFYPDGSATGGRVTFSRDGRHMVVDVDWLTGRARVLDP